MRQKTFIFYLCDTQTGNCYYYDINGVLKFANIHSGADVVLKNAPGEWMNIELGFMRNPYYFGLNRSFATPMKLTKETAKIVRELFYKGIGVEVPLTLIVFKYNDNVLPGDPIYKLYYKSQLDLPKFNDTVAESFDVNLMEGGIIQLLKAYENTQFQIPCDGSIPENVKINYDGMKVSDTLYYNISPFAPIGNYYKPVIALGANYVTNEGDNYNLVKNSPGYDNVATFGGTTTTVPQYVLLSPNYLVSFTEPTTVTIEGSIIVKKGTYSGDIGFNFFYRTNYNGANVSLIGVTTSNILLEGQQVYNFNTSIDLLPGERLFLFLTNNLGGTPLDTDTTLEVISGNINVSFTSKAKNTRAWGISAYDLLKLIVKNICAIGSTNIQTYNYQVNSALLQSKLNFIVNSGDALRASGDPSYQKFFNVTRLTSGTGTIIQNNYGPVIKTSLKDFHDSFGSILMTALGYETTGGNDMLFYEHLSYVLNTSNQIDIGEVAELKVEFAEEFTMSNLKIGYKSQSYDQKAGKYEWNTTAEWVANVKSFNKEVVKISKYRADAYGIEKLRGQITTNTSTTKNDSDNSVFITNVDRNSFIYDYYKAYFKSSAPGDLLADIIIQPLTIAASIKLPYQDGGYFQFDNDFAVLVIATPAYSSTNSCNITINGTISPDGHIPGTPLDTVIFKVWHNGVILYQETVTVSGVGTPIAVNHNFSQLIQTYDCIYVSCETSATGSVLLSSFSLTVGSLFVATGIPGVKIPGGVARKLLNFPSVTPSSNPFVPGVSVVQNSNQYYLYNELTSNNDFDLSLNINGRFLAPIGTNIVFRVYLNGIVIRTITQTGTGGILSFSITDIFPGNPYTFALGDVLFINVTTAGVSLADLSLVELIATSTYIKAFNLKRVQYNTVTGIPSLVKDAAGVVRYDLPGCPYNIEELTPKRMLNNWGAYIRGGLYNQPASSLIFQTLSKNEFLATYDNNGSVIENEDVLISNLASPLFYPYHFNFKTKVPVNFADLLTGAANAHIKFTFNGLEFYGFPISVKQKPALNESQEWKLLCSPVTDLNNLVNLNIDGINTLYMGPNSIGLSHLNPIQAVPEGQVLPAKYHTYNRNSFWYSEQVGNWLNQKNYWNPVQIGDPIPFQVITSGLAPVEYNVYKCDGTLVTTDTFATVTTGAIAPTYTLWETVIDTSVWTEGAYYIQIVAGGTVKLISEGLDVRANWPETLLFEYKNSKNVQSMVFSTGFTGSLRIKGYFDNNFKQKFKAAQFVDQVQDIDILNAIPFEVTDLYVGLDDGAPDYISRKASRIMLLDEVYIEGEQFTINEGSEWDTITVEGSPKKYQKIEIRPAVNQFGIAVNAGGIVNNVAMLVTVDAAAFGPNAGNASGSVSPDIIEVNIN